METLSFAHAAPQQVPLHKRLVSAAVLVTYAEQRGMPTPDSVTASCGEVVFSFERLAELADWALWFDVQVAESEPLHGGAIVHEASGIGLGEGLRLVHVEHTDAAEAPIPFVLTDQWVG